MATYVMGHTGNIGKLHNASIDKGEITKMLWTQTEFNTAINESQKQINGEDYQTMKRKRWRVKQMVIKIKKKQEKLTFEN